jgi:fluoride exporter
MNKFVLVFLGGGLGSVARYWLGLKIQTFSNNNFPLGTFTVNIIASFVLGFIVGLALLKQGNFESQRLLIGVGFCGGLSTFSAFTMESASLLKSGSITLALVYMFTSIIVCVGSFVMAQALVR